MNSTIKIVLFLTLIYFTTQQGLLCTVPNCTACSYPQVCGLCQNNFVLTFNASIATYQCTPVTCPANCMTCYQNNTCQICNTNFTITINGTCVSGQPLNTTLPPNCLLGANSMNCSLCNYGYTLQYGFCYPTITLTAADPNCIVKLNSDVCQVCQSGYVVGFLGKCVINQFNQICNSTTNPNCLYCASTNGNCLLCYPPYQLNTTSGSCIYPSCGTTITGCSFCTNSTQCQSCYPGYILVNNTCQMIGYGCNVMWCQTCSNSQSCGQCNVGYQLSPFTTGVNTVYLCTKIVCPFNVTNCMTCTQNYNATYLYNQVLCAANGCMPNYVNIHGYCIFNRTILTGSPTNCDIAVVPNCISCSTSNFCNQCQVGYSLRRDGTCRPNFCTVQDCQNCSIDNVCQVCNAGFTLTIGNISLFTGNYNITNFLMYLGTQQCTLTSNIICNITGCSYCLTSNVCSVCWSGFMLNSNNSMCTPTCNVTNCNQCNITSSTITSTACLFCQPGFTLSSNGSQCIMKTFSCGAGCSNTTGSCMYNWNTNAGQCYQCNGNMILYNGQCISPTCNIYGCQICAPWAASNTQCLKCNQSLILSDGYCITSNCNNGVANCVNCIGNGTCLGCNQGFYLNSTNGTITCVLASTIQNCSVPNCLSCVAGNPNMCSVCAAPYTNNNTGGICVCPFENCLDCSQSTQACNSCPPPLFATMIQKDCVPQPSLNNNCNINNCEYCFTSNKCAVCAIGYHLQRINYSCLQNDCASLNLTNCQFCDQFGYQCQLCKNGYMINNFLQGGQCYPINSGYTCNITGCSVCSSTNNSICIACLPTFSYNSNSSTYCTPFTCNIANCYLCLANNFCTVCVEGYYLANNMKCVAKFSQIVNCNNSITYCAMCVTGLYSPVSSTPYCIMCMPGFQYNMMLGSCLPQQNSIPNCLVQMPNFNLMNLPACVMCQQGYYLNSFSMCSQYSPAPNNSNCSVYNCMYCGLNSTTCSFCFIPWGISPTGMCLANAANICGKNCASCLNGTLCVTCMPTYLPYTNGTCVSCNIAGCNYCQTAGICSSCTTNYLLASNGICILCNISGCSNCSNNNVCSACTNNMTVPDYLGSQCIMCNVPNCISCSSNNLCKICFSGFQLFPNTNSTNTKQCVSCSVANCMTCNNDNYCTGCLTGYTLINQTCTLCQYPCVTCNSNTNSTSCATCVYPAFLPTALNNGSCIPASIANCQTYNPYINGSALTCNTCNTGYIYNSTLNMCLYQCNNTLCATCFTNNTCVSCNSTGCTACTNSTLCTSCSPGFYINVGECKQCPGYCAICSSATVCTQLINNNNQVLVTINSQTYLALCAQGCIQCSNINTAICLTCASGLYLNPQGVCLLCNQNCMTCNSSNPNTCLSCYPNSFLVQGSCLVCSSNCQTCLASDLSACQTCNPGYFIGSNNTCVQGCPLNCQQCLTSSMCTQCSSGYTLFNAIVNNSSQTICVSCSLNCRTCAQNSPTSCVTCGAGFYLSGTICTACTTNCLLCSSAGCSQCIQGFFLNSALTCSPNCQFPCATCSANIPTKCSSCIAGYTYSSITNTCTPQLTCAGACTVCPIGYILTLGQCLQCGPSSCQQCNTTNINQCYSCTPGYFLNVNQTCQACQPSCATCLRSDGCTTCATGYTYNNLIQIKPSGYQCMACQSPCATCLGSVNTCTSCVAGFSIIGWKCTQTFTFLFGIILSTNLTYFNQQYYQFITQLSTAVGSSNPNVVSILGVTLGSVIVAGQIAPSGQSGTLQSNQQFYDLDGVLQQNQIAGMQIVAVQLQVIGGDIDYSKVNLALILGICIPVAILIIAGVSLYLYRKNKTRSILIIKKIQDDSKYNQRQSFELSGSYKQAEDTNRPL